MVEIVPVMQSDVRFLGIVLYFPKCTMRMLFNRKLMILDSCFDIQTMSEKCPVSMIQCSSGNFETMFDSRVLRISQNTLKTGIQTGMKVKEAIECIFSQKETSEEFF